MYQPLPLLLSRPVLRTVVLGLGGPDVGPVVGVLVVRGVLGGAGQLGCKQAPVVTGHCFWFRFLHTFLSVNDKPTPKNR